MSAARELSANRLRELLHYDPDTGLFTRIVSLSNSVRVGDLAGTLTHGYWRIRVDGKVYSGHRLAWLYMTGEWPDFEIDHRDTDASNNRWGNLRPADRTGNTANTKRRSDNLSGLKGVCWNKQSRKWRSEITVRGRRIFLGYFNTAEEAHAAYCAAAREHFGEFARAA